MYYYFSKMISEPEKKTQKERGKKMKEKKSAT
jgi:hypothetical protein